MLGAELLRSVSGPEFGPGDPGGQVGCDCLPCTGANPRIRSSHHRQVIGDAWIVRLVRRKRRPELTHGLGQLPQFVIRFHEDDQGAGPILESRERNPDGEQLRQGAERGVLPLVRPEEREADGHVSGDSVACRPVVLRTPFADEWLGVGCDQEQRHTLDSDDAVVLRDHPSELGRSEPARVQPLQVCVGRPTGDGATLSDVDRNAVVDELLQQLLQRRNADTFDLPCVLARDELRPIACQRNRALLPFDDRAVGRNVERKRRSRRIASPCRYQIEDLHRASVRRRVSSIK